MGDKPTEGDKLTPKLNQNYLLVGDKPTPNPTEGDKLTTKHNQNYLLVGYKPTAKPTEGDKLTTKTIYLLEINKHLNPTKT